MKHNREARNKYEESLYFWVERTFLKTGAEAWEIVDRLIRINRNNGMNPEKLSKAMREVLLRYTKSDEFKKAVRAALKVQKDTASK